MEKKMHLKVTAPYDDEFVLVSLVEGNEMKAWGAYDFLNDLFEEPAHFCHNYEEDDVTVEDWLKRVDQEGLTEDLNQLKTADFSFAWDEKEEWHTQREVAAILQRATIKPYVENGSFLPFSLPRGLGNTKARALAAAAICDEMDRYTGRQPLVDFGVKIERVTDECTLEVSYSVYSAGYEFGNWEFWKALGSPAPGLVEFGIRDGKHLAAQYLDEAGHLVNVTFMLPRPHSMTEEMLNSLGESRYPKAIQYLFENEDEQLDCKDLVKKLANAASGAVSKAGTKQSEVSYLYVIRPERKLNDGCAKSVAEDAQRASDRADISKTNHVTISR